MSLADLKRRPPAPNHPSLVPLGCLIPRRADGGQGEDQTTSGSTADRLCEPSESGVWVRVGKAISGPDAETHGNTQCCAQAPLSGTPAQPPGSASGVDRSVCLSWP